MTAKERLHSMADDLSEAEAARVVALVEEHLDDPMVRALDAAPLDDELTTPEEDEGAREALEEYRSGQAVAGFDLGSQRGSAKPPRHSRSRAVDIAESRLLTCISPVSSRG